MKIAGEQLRFASVWRGPWWRVLCVLLVEQPLLAEAQVVRRAPTAPRGIQGEERVLHALNRFTFGPRPGDVEAVEAMGLERWFEQQLNPAVDRRLGAGGSGWRCFRR